jgi:hypothetical protein
MSRQVLTICAQHLQVTFGDVELKCVQRTKRAYSLREAKKKAQILLLETCTREVQGEAPPTLAVELGHVSHLESIGGCGGSRTSSTM